MMDDFNSEEKLDFPRHMSYLYISYVLERYTHYSIRSFLTSLFIHVFCITDTQANLYHLFYEASTVLLPFVGAISADGYIGKYYTILTNYVFYLLGVVLLMFAAAAPRHPTALPPSLPPHSLTSDDNAIVELITMVLGLVLVAFGRAGVYTPLLVLGGDQYMPLRKARQRRALLAFYAWLTLMCNAAMVVHMIVSPYVRRPPCFGYDSCLWLLFCIAAITLKAAFAVFIVVKKKFCIPPSNKKGLTDSLKCVVFALKEKRKSSETKAHWLDYSLPKYDAKLIDDLKAFLRFVGVCVPLPIFWALFSPPTSPWLPVLHNMNGHIGALLIRPEHILILNPLLMVVFIPIFEYIIYPHFYSRGLLRTPLQRIVFGAILLTFIVFVTATLCLHFEYHRPTHPGRREANLFIYNSNPCNVMVDVLHTRHKTTLVPIEPMDYFLYVVPVPDKVLMHVHVAGSCIPAMELDVTIKEHMNYGVHIANDEIVLYKEDTERCDYGAAKVRLLINGGNVTTAMNESKFELVLHGETMLTLRSVDRSRDKTTYNLLDMGTYQLVYNGYEQQTQGEDNMLFGMGGVYVLLVYAKDENTSVVKSIEITHHFEVHIIWIVPQFVVLSAAEILLTVTLLQFAYVEAPPAMNTLTVAALSVSESLGHLISIVFKLPALNARLSATFFVYGLLMAINVVALVQISIRYVYSGADKIFRRSSIMNTAPGGSGT